jgi:hypothetical protein
MKVTIRYFDGCPNWKEADARLREAFVATGTEAEIVFEPVETQEEAERLRFAGSPTILLDGADPFPAETQSFGLTCRVYRTEVGNEGSPSVEQFVSALRR